MGRVGLYGRSLGDCVARAGQSAWSNDAVGRHMQGRRATIKAHPAPLHHPRPYRW